MLRSSLHRHLGTLGFLALAATSFPIVAAAQVSTTEQAPNAQSEYRKAHDAAKARNWPEARRILLGLWKREKTYDVAASLSEAEFALGHVAASAQYMDYALRHVTPNESATTIANMRGALEKIRPKVGGAKVIINDPTAQLRVDGEAIDLEPNVEVFLDPGQHVLEATAGDRKVSKTIAVRAGETQTLEFQLPPAPSTSAAPPESGGAAALVAPNPADSAEPGGGVRHIVLIAGGALAVAGLGTGIGFGVASNSAESDVEDYRARVGSGGCQGSSPSADCSALRDAADSQRRSSLIANVGYGVAAAGLVAVGVALLWPESNDAESSRSARFELRCTGSGVSFGGTF
jgi:hypothetical protein